MITPPRQNWLSSWGFEDTSKKEFEEWWVTSPVVDAVSIATRLKNEGIGGLILTSARSDGRWGAVTDYEAGVVTVPVLLVQHTQDTCPGTLYRKLGRVVNFYKRSSNKVDVILVSGGNGKDRGNNCQNGFHAFAGLEKETATAIANWVLGRDFPGSIHD